MSAAQLSRTHSRSARSQGSRTSDSVAHLDVPHPDAHDHLDRSFEPCAATASFFLHAQRNVIFCLHHDTLALERKFEKHTDDVLLIYADNVSERGAGRYVVSYDAGHNVIVWDLFTGEQIARFVTYGPITTAAWMRNGSVAFGTNEGSVILFDPATHEHVSQRTIFDPVTALAPAVDCNTFAIGYLNGSILIATLQPFTIVHTLNTSRGPSPITGLAWHGSSSKQKTEMLATQTSAGDLRVWSVGKPPSNDPPRIIRILGEPEISNSSRSWFAWSKNGRLLQHTDGQTRAWDVRTKRVSHELIPTVSDVVAIANYGPTATLFTISTHQMVQQYDVNPSSQAVMVANKPHAPINAPPTPPDSIPRETPPPIEPPTVPISIEGSSEDEGATMSPLQKIAHEMDQLEEERRDQVGPLSPVSSRASSRNSMSSAGSYGRRNKSHSRERQKSSNESDGTVFSSASSMASSLRTGHESISIRSVSTSASKYKPSSLRQEMLRSPEDAKKMKVINLFPFTEARLSDVKFRSPQYPALKTPDVLRNEMLSIIFGWDDDIDALVRDEQARHQPGSASSVLLAKWLGDDGADALTQMVGSQSMTSSDWMLLALSCQMGQGSQSQKQIGEAFVRRLLETDEVHPAVAILLGLGERNDAIEAYVSRQYYMEAVLLTCLLFPNDWQRQSFLVRKWGELEVSRGKHEFAVRCFSCTSIDTSEPWFSPRAQDEVYAAQQKELASMSPPASPPSATTTNRLAAMNASLKLITNFEKPAKMTQQSNVGVTPIIDSALSPGGAMPSWKRSTSRGLRDPSSARTATPGGYGRKREPSADIHTAIEVDADATPLVDRKAPSRPGSSLSNKDPGTAVRARRAASDAVSSPAAGLFHQPRERSRAREASRDRNHNGLQIQMVRTQEMEDATSPHPTSAHSRTRSTAASLVSSRRDDLSPLLTSDSTRSFKGRNIDRYINSLEEANIEAQQLRAQNRSRTESRDGRSKSRTRKRDQSESRGEVTYIKPAKRSPSSPVAMPSDDAARYASDARHESSDVTSPVDSRADKVRSSSRSAPARRRADSTARREESPSGRSGVRSSSRKARGSSRVRQTGADGSDSRDERGRGQDRRVAGNRSPSSPSPMDAYRGRTDDEPVSARPRQRSTSRLPPDSGRRTGSPERGTRARSSSRRPRQAEPMSATRSRASAEEELPMEPAKLSPRHVDLPDRTQEAARKAAAAKELEDRRLSLARRPSAPSILHPEQLSGNRPNMSPRSLTESSVLSFGELDRQRSRTVDPEHMRHGSNGGSTSATTAKPLIGLPATPRAMRHPRYMSSDPDPADAIPAVPALPDSYSGKPSQPSSGNDKLGPLLPSSVFSPKGGLGRSASAPPEQSSTQQRPRADSVSKHARRPSRDGPIETISEVSTSDEANVVIVEETGPPMLPELQHLATPPPPPPPPAAPGSYFPAAAGGPSGVINIAMDAGADAPAPSASPSVRRGRGNSMSQGSGPPSATETTSIGSKWRNITSRVRETSRTRGAKSPPVNDYGAQSHTPSPYETQLPGLNWRVTSPHGDMPSLPNNGGSPPRAPANASTAYRNPKEIREQLRPDAYGGSLEGGMI